MYSRLNDVAILSSISRVFTCAWADRCVFVRPTNSHVRLKVIAFRPALLKSAGSMNHPFDMMLPSTRYSVRVDPTAMSDVTRILTAIDQGDPSAAEQLLPLVYEELRRLAAQKLSQEKPGQTLQATAIVHEAYLRLVGSKDQHWDSRGHFFAAAAEAMQRILVENARRKQRHRHGGGQTRQELRESDLVVDVPSDDLVALDEALKKLATEDPKIASLVSLRYFAGLTMEQAAGVLGVGLRTAERYWTYARAWLHNEIGKGDNTADR